MAIENLPGIDTPEPALSRPRPGGKQDFFGKDGFGFFDFLDIINPLQHIPILSGLYRKITGDEISPAARLIGGSLFGGPIGFAAALANVVVEDASGTDIGGHIFAMVDGEGETPELIPAQVASAAPFGGGVVSFGGGAASGADATPIVAPPVLPFGAGTLGGATAAHNGLFALSFDLPAAAYDEDSSRSETKGPTDDRFARFSAGSAVRAEDLSADQLVQILTQFQRGTGASPSLAALSVEPGPPPRPAIFPLDPTLD